MVDFLWHLKITRLKSKIFMKTWAKEAAQEAEDMDDDNRLITMVDIKTAARRSCMQNSEISEEICMHIDQK